MAGVGTWRRVGAAALAAVILVAAPSSGLAAEPTSSAARRAALTLAALDPREIALTPDDLVPGFSVDPATSGITPLPGSAGVTYRVDMKRNITPRTLSEGPILVQQIVVRVDDGTPPEDVLMAVRDELVGRVEFVPTPEGPNDGGTISLARTDGEVTLYSVGFVKANFVIVTTWGGRAEVTTYPKLLDLAGVSSGRLDERLAAQ